MLEVLDVLLKAKASPEAWTFFIWGLGISKLQFLIKKICFFSSCKLFLIICHKNPGTWIWIRFDQK
jgi:hypothetical protein